MSVRNTIRNIDPTVFQDAKLFAGFTQQTLGEVITMSLQNYIHNEETILMVEGWLDQLGSEVNIEEFTS